LIFTFASLHLVSVETAHVGAIHSNEPPLKPGRISLGKKYLDVISNLGVP
jgi:hypothetical protein